MSQVHIFVHSGGAKSDRAGERECPIPSFGFLLLLALFMLGALGAHAQNLVKNGGFDHDITGWTVVPFPNGVTWSPQDARGATNSGSLRETCCSGSSFSRAYQMIDITPGATYTISGYIRDETTLPGPAAVVFVNWLDGLGRTISGIHTGFDSIGKSAWHKGTATGTAPPEATRMELNMNLYFRDASTGFALFDDLAVTMIEAPTATLVATPASIAPGHSSTLAWTTSNATTVTINNGLGGQARSGSTTVSPTATTTYTLTATGSGGTRTATATVTVIAPETPRITFSATPSVIAAGGTSTLKWMTSNATAVTIDQGIGAKPVDGMLAVSPTTTTTYRLTAMGAGGTKTATVTVTIAAAPTIFFTATPTALLPGGSVKLEWQVFDATTVVLDPGLGLQPMTGAMTVTPATSTTYLLTATGQGGTRVAHVTVTVGGKRRAVRH